VADTSRVICDSVLMEGSPGNPQNESKPLLDDADDPSDESYEDLADAIGPGRFEFEFPYYPDGGTPQWISFSWDGGTHAEWEQDIGGGAGLSPASSAPVYGWASWLNGNDVLLMYYSPDMGSEGWARVPGVAPDEDDPKSWVKLGRAIVAAIYGDYTQWPGMSGEHYL
jgi:hypothetical protein